ncbi:MAG: hypothetical protein HOI24_00750, partial [Candidatus Magasanikbacteria bacterium]|nr:hypothetical protein [Candidatus Magasanikbacteria bacterium]
EGKGAGGGKPGSPKVPGGELPEDQAEGAPKETGAGEKKQKAQAAALARDKQSGRRKREKGEKGVQQEEPKGTEKKLDKSKIKKKEKEIAKKKELIAALEFNKFTYAMFFAYLLDISSLLAALLEIIPIIDILGAMIHYISLFLFGIPIILILLLLIKRIVATKDKEITREVRKYIVKKGATALFIELIPIVNGAPLVIWLIFKVKIFLFIIRYAQESELKKLQKELKKLEN